MAFGFEVGKRAIARASRPTPATSSERSFAAAHGVAPSHAQVSALPKVRTAPTRVKVAAHTRSAPTFHRQLINARRTFFTAPASASLLRRPSLGLSSVSDRQSALTGNPLQTWLNRHDPQYQYRTNVYSDKTGLHVEPTQIPRKVPIPREVTGIAEKRATHLIDKVALPQAGGKAPKVKVEKIPSGNYAQEVNNQIILSPGAARDLAGFKPSRSRRYAKQSVLHEFAHTRQNSPYQTPKEQALAEGGADAYAQYLMNRTYGQGAAVPSSTSAYATDTRNVRRRGRDYVTRKQFLQYGRLR